MFLKFDLFEKHRGKEKERERDPACVVSFLFVAAMTILTTPSTFILASVQTFGHILLLFQECYQELEMEQPRIKLGLEYGRLTLQVAA